MTKKILVLFLVNFLVCVKPSVSVLCFSRVNRNTGQCAASLGEVDKDDCCLNINNGFQYPGGVCQSCGHPVWTAWTPWSSCNVHCGKGVKQRTRTCFGIGECEAPDIKLEMLQCDGICCDAKGWGLWNPWSSCSHSCGEHGERRRERVCNSPSKCRSTCGGASHETEPCPQKNACPVPGSWSKWASWSQCSTTCITEHVNPIRRRHRSCSGAASSPDTGQPAFTCRGETDQVQPCTEINNCPVDGSWGEWSIPGPCSTTCGEGLQLSTRQCNNPAPKYGGKYCEGTSARTSDCMKQCPVDGFWSGWSYWAECSASCVPEGGAVVRKRHRFCSNPAPSSDPPGQNCPGDPTDVQPCPNVPLCAVDGAWGSWSPFTSCSVTCGVGLQHSSRKCENPSPKHGGKPCLGDAHRSSTCNKKVPCPVDGHWSTWGSWSPCLYAHDESVSISCALIGGLQWQRRTCLNRSPGGLPCEGELMDKSRVCYDIGGCELDASWVGWASWTSCQPTCGLESARKRMWTCTPNTTQYSGTVGIQNSLATFSGTPDVDCGNPPGGELVESDPCVNAPPCPPSD